MSTVTDSDPFLNVSANDTFLAEINFGHFSNLYLAQLTQRVLTQSKLTEHWTNSKEKLLQFCNFFLLFLPYTFLSTSVLFL